METEVRRLFERYERSFNEALRGHVDLKEAMSFYAPAFISATPFGVAAGANDDGLKRALEQGYTHYRETGTKEMRVTGIRTTPVDEGHCIAHVAWTATYARRDKADVSIDFEVHYLIQKLGQEPTIFGWIAGDEQALLRKHGIA